MPGRSGGVDRTGRGQSPTSRLDQSLRGRARPTDTHRRRADPTWAQGVGWARVFGHQPVWLQWVWSTGQWPSWGSGSRAWQGKWPVRSGVLLSLPASGQVSQAEATAPMLTPWVLNSQPSPALRSCSNSKGPKLQPATALHLWPLKRTDAPGLCRTLAGGGGPAARPASRWRGRPGSQVSTLVHL